MNPDSGANKDFKSRLTQVIRPFRVLGFPKQPNPVSFLQDLGSKHKCVIWKTRKYSMRPALKALVNNLKRKNAHFLR